MGVKLYKLSGMIKNLIIFIILSLFFLHIIRSLSLGVSAFSPISLLGFFKQYYLMPLLLILTCYLVYHAKQSSKFFLLIYTGLIFYFGVHYFWAYFDKVILLMDAIYLIFAFYFNLGWNNELSDVIYSPGYGQFHFGRRSPYNFDVNVEWDDAIGEGHLTNWSENSCFLVVHKKLEKLPSKIKITIPFEGNTFVTSGEVLSSFGDDGLGIFIHRQEDEHMYNWQAFYDIVSERGHTPEFTRA